MFFADKKISNKNIFLSYIFLSAQDRCLAIPLRSDVVRFQFTGHALTVIWTGARTQGRWYAGRPGRRRGRAGFGCCAGRWMVEHRFAEHPSLRGGLTCGVGCDAWGSG